MTVILILLSVIVGGGGLLYIHHRLTFRPDEPADSPEAQPEAAPGQVCCGQHLVCEKGLPKTDEIIYYDDEELDAYAGRDPRAYTEAETEEFRDVLLTLLPSDIAGWAQSLRLRGIALPPAVDQELMLVLSEAAASPTFSPSPNSSSPNPSSSNPLSSNPSSVSTRSPAP